MVGLGSLEECAGDAGFLGAKEGSIQIGSRGSKKIAERCPGRQVYMKLNRKCVPDVIEHSAGMLISITLPN